MGTGSGQSFGKFIREVRVFGHVGQAVGETGESIGTPIELSQARLTNTLCERFSCLPSQLMNEDADLIMHMLTLLIESGDLQEPSYGE